MKLATFASIVLSLGVATIGLAQTAETMTYAGDGLSLVITDLADDGSASGQLMFNGATYPFAGTVSEVNGVGVGKGTFTANGSSFEFTTRERDDGSVDFVTGGKAYTLQLVEPKAAANPPANEPANNDAANPIANQTPAADAKKPAPAAAKNDNNKNKAVMPPTLKLLRMSFPDISMGGVAAYTMLVPEGWQAQGQIAWQDVGGVIPFPQKRLDVVAPGGSRVRVVPTIARSYSAPTAAARAQNAAMAANMDPGVRPPDDAGAFGVALVQSQNPQGTNFTLIEAVRDEQADAMLDDMERKNPNPNGPPGSHSTWYVHVRYDEGGKTWHEQIHFGLSATPVQRTQWVDFGNWQAYVYEEIRATDANFEAAKPLLMMISSTFQPTAKWSVQSYLASSQMIAQQHEQNMARILERGRQIEQTTDAQIADFKARMGQGDKEQAARLDTLYEVDNFKTPDGGVVKLPIHYKNYYGDGKGNFVMTQSTNDAPGGPFKELQKAD